MRRHDLRRFDIRLMISILSTFCIGSFIFLLLWMFNFLVIDLKFYLWTSYAVFFVIAAIVYFTTKQAKIVWTKPKTKKEITSTSKFKLDQGQSYLIKDKKKSRLRKVYRDAVIHGKKGMFVTRSNPKIIKKKLRLKDPLLLWLTEVDTNNAIDPVDIEELSYVIKKFLRKSTDTIISFEGIEYLTNVLPFKKVLHFIQDLRDEIALKNSNLLLRVDPGVLKFKELKLIEKEFVEWDKNGI